MDSRAPLIRPIICLPEWYGKRSHGVEAHELWERVVQYDPTSIFIRLNGMLNPYKRIQSGLSMEQMWPYGNGVCACGCGQSTKKYKFADKHYKYASDKCSMFCNAVFSIVYGDLKSIAKYLHFIHGEGCRRCWIITAYETDHIVPVKFGGGASWLSNFQNLCTKCHREKTNNDFGWKQPKPIPLFK